ncbi:hypothetical protein C5O70_08350 [Streptococcus pseudopneumoniae]|uniref:Transposase n=1 Tax=Streptococcus pseudopneumoniae TaxID=257758 RepID=A0A3A4WQU3_9STRE|nr:hypothetical protein C5O71_05245 [Streptococcus pseudopneumoniae]RJP10890.1 hypothetical protein C5O69_07520 [Streptococcus pseudopneumoniae]RJP78902.1 hypothetical protein C5O68_10555 [Streptococcus pseudopneumoniae]RJQ60000.1 hypothetical protein C5O70_08350 [Streptococcus pseudopneumoniae]RJY10631.1 hypothetical protein D6867_07590 [Streptococcus pseudopneumoniae]
MFLRRFSDTPFLQSYQKEISRSYTGDAFCQLLKRHSWRTVALGPKKAGAQTIAASKHPISIQEGKKTL